MNRSPPPTQQPDIHPHTDEEPLEDLLRHYWWLFKRYYWVFLLTGFVSLAAAYGWTKQQPKLYQSTSKIIFHPGQPNVFGKNIEPVQFANTGDRYRFKRFWNTQKEVLRSRPFLEKVVTNNNFTDHPYFRASAESADNSPRKAGTEAIIDRILQMTTISRRPESRVGAITVETNNPELSANVANAIADEYLSYIEDIQSGGVKRIVEWFDQYVKTKEEELRQAQQKLQKFKKKHNILSMSYKDRQNLTTENMRSVNNELNKVRTQLSKKEALLDQIHSIQNTDKQLTALSGLLDSSSLESLLEQKSTLKQKLAKLRARYLEKHPKVKEIQKQLSTLEKAIQKELSRRISQLETEVQTLRRRKKKFEKRLANIRDKIFDLNQLGVRYKQLKNRSQNLEKLYETVLTRSGELDFTSIYKQNTIEILERGSKPDHPVSPSLPLNLALGLFVGLGLGVTTTLLIDSLDTTLKDVEELSQYPNLPLLGLLPKIDESSIKQAPEGVSAKDLVTHFNPRGSFAESIKTVRTNLTFAASEGDLNTLLITSAGVAAGKTLVSVNLGIATAQSGQRTLIVESDLRRPRISEALGLKPEKGITSVVQGDASLEDAIVQTPVENLELLPCVEESLHPSELLQSARFQQSLEQLEQKYDRLLLDSPPTTSVSDALIMSQFADGVLLVVKFGVTRRRALSHTLDQMEAIEAPLLGYVANEATDEAAGYRYQYGYYGYTQPY